MSINTESLQCGERQLNKCEKDLVKKIDDAIDSSQLDFDGKVSALCVVLTGLVDGSSLKKAVIGNDDVKITIENSNHKKTMPSKQDLLKLLDELQEALSDDLRREKCKYKKQSQKSE